MALGKSQTLPPLRSRNRRRRRTVRISYVVLLLAWTVVLLGATGVYFAGTNNNNTRNDMLLSTTVKKKRLLVLLDYTSSTTTTTTNGSSTSASSSSSSSSYSIKGDSDGDSNGDSDGDSNGDSDSESHHSSSVYSSTRFLSLEDTRNGGVELLHKWPSANANARTTSADRDKNNKNKPQPRHRILVEGYDVFKNSGDGRVMRHMIEQFVRADDMVVQIKSSRYIAHGFNTTDRQLSAILPYVDRPFLYGSAVVTIRWFWPPKLSFPVRTSYWIIQQAWEFGYLPLSFVHLFVECVDELWVPSPYVARSFVRSGVPGDMVHVIPHGIDLHFFKRAATHANTLYKRRQVGPFKFLFHGGFLPRKVPIFFRSRLAIWHCLSAFSLGFLFLFILIYTCVCCSRMFSVCLFVLTIIRVWMCWFVRIPKNLLPTRMWFWLYTPIMVMDFMHKNCTSPWQTLLIPLSNWIYAISTILVYVNSTHLRMLTYLLSVERALGSHIWYKCKLVFN